jgi:hypothetical protein
MRLAGVGALVALALVPVQSGAALPRIRAVIVSATSGAKLAETTGAAPRPLGATIGDGRGGFFVSGAGGVVRVRANGTLDPSFTSTPATIVGLVLTRGVLVTAGPAGLSFLDPATGTPVHPALPLAPAGIQVFVSGLAASGPLVFVVGSNRRGERGSSQLAFGANVLTGSRTAFHPSIRKGTASAVAAVGPIVYLAGDFRRVGGAVRCGIASVTAATGALRAWKPVACLTEPPAAMRATSHTLFLGHLHGFLALRSDNGRRLTWSLRTGKAFSSAGIASLALAGHTLYLGTSADATPVRLDGRARRGFVALDTRNGAVLPFEVRVAHFENGKGIAVSGARVLAYGSFSSSP